MVPTHITVFFGDCPDSHKFEERDFSGDLRQLFGSEQFAALQGRELVFNGWRVLVIGEVQDQELGFRLLLCRLLYDDTSFGTTTSLFPVSEES